MPVQNAAQDRAPVCEKAMQAHAGFRPLDFNRVSGTYRGYRVGVSQSRLEKR